MSDFMLDLLFHQIPSALRDALQLGYDLYRVYFGKSHFHEDVIGPMFVVMVVFWSLATLYTILDLTQKPALLYRYKTQDDKGVTLQEVWKVARKVLWNQIFVQSTTTVGNLYLMEYRGMDDSQRVPPIDTVLVHLVVFVFIQETSFYYLHRMLHHRIAYRLVHKTHHYWQAPIAISALYCHPLEHFLANLVPVLLGPVLLGSHRSVILVWLIIVHIVTLNDHSGYHFPLFPSPEFHDYHHLKFNQNFGRMGLLDYVHGTSDRYLQSKYSKRHQVLLSATPIKHSFPY